MINNDYLPKNKKNIKNRKARKKLLAELITTSIDYNSSIEFSGASYTDEDNIEPTISKYLKNNNKNTTLVSPNLNNSIFYNFLVIKTSKDNPFWKYSFISPSNHAMISDYDIFIAEDNVPKAVNTFKTIAALGGTCVYAMSGNDFSKLIENSEKLRIDLDKTTNGILTTELAAKSENDLSAAIVIIKRKK